MHMLSASREFGTSPTKPIFLATKSEPAYLQQLDLFLPGEKRRIKRSDFLSVMVRGCYDDQLTYWRATVLACDEAG